jgi:hypothetical protein
LQHAKDPYNGVKFAIVGKITSHFSPTVPVSLLEVFCVVVDVGAPGGASGNFQSRVSTISLHGCGTPGDDSLRGPTEVEEEEEEGEEEEEEEGEGEEEEEEEEEIFPYNGELVFLISGYE